MAARHQASTGFSDDVLHDYARRGDRLTAVARAPRIHGLVQRVTLPTQVGVLQAEALLAGVRAADESHDPQIVVDGSAVRFFDHPAGLCVLACAGKRWNAAGRTVQFEGLSPSLTNYLERMDVLQHCGVRDRPRIARNAKPDRLLEVTCIADKSAIDDAAFRLARAVVGTVPNIAPDANIDGMRIDSETDRLELSVSHMLAELMDNALSHGRRGHYGSAEVWIASQYVPTRDALRIAVVDDGCGLLTSLSHHPDVARDPTHANAITAAFTPGVSCNRAVGLAGVESPNLGMGLTICHELAIAARGSMWVGTGDRWVRNPRGGGPRYEVKTEGWQGLIAAAELYRSQLKDVRVADIVGRYRPKGSRPSLRYG